MATMLKNPMDNKTNNFHRKLSILESKQKKSIISLKDDNKGQLVTNEVQIGKLTNGFFTNLFTKDDLVVPELINHREAAN
jgi:hypothetical protein